MWTQPRGGLTKHIWDDGSRACPLNREVHRYVRFWPVFFQRTPLNDGGTSAVVGGRDHFLHPPTSEYCRRHISPSLTSSVRFFDSAEGVYSTSSASEVGSCRHPTSPPSTARHGLKRLHHGSAQVAQASQRGWMDNFRRDPPLNRPLASCSRCLATRSI